MKEIEDTSHGSVESGDPGVFVCFITTQISVDQSNRLFNLKGSTWSTEEAATFLRSLGPAECFQSATDKVLQHGVDDSVFFELSLNELQAVCGHVRSYFHMCEYKHSTTDACVITVTHGRY